MSTPGLLLVGLAIVVGLVGIVVPVLPGAFLILGAIFVWALVEQSAVGWSAFAVAAFCTLAAQVLKYLLPGRHLKAGGIPSSTLAIGGLVGIVGFFVVPVVGLPLGFVLGVYLVELNRRTDLRQAWDATLLAMRAVGWSILIELAGGLLATAAWLSAVVAV
jgi:uncharacterized protein YqgC (DUF456 family)